MPITACKLTHIFVSSSVSVYFIADKLRISPHRIGESPSMILSMEFPKNRFTIISPSCRLRNTAHQRSICTQNCSRMSHRSRLFRENSAHLFFVFHRQAARSSSFRHFANHQLWPRCHFWVVSCYFIWFYYHVSITFPAFPACLGVYISVWSSINFVHAE